MINRFQGDPALKQNNSGTTLKFVAGQPVMDAGLENLAAISLLTSPGWWGNDLADTGDERIGSTFEEQARGTITLSKLSDIEQGAKNALDNPAFGSVDAVALNPASTRVDLTITIKPPGRDIDELQLIRNGQNWINQAEQPANEQLEDR